VTKDDATEKYIHQTDFNKGSWAITASSSLYSSMKMNHGKHYDILK